MWSARPTGPDADEASAAPVAPILGTRLIRAAARDPQGTTIAIGLFAIALVTYMTINHGRPANLDYFVPLADAFLHGRLGLTDAPPWLNELVRVGSLGYVVYPPMPAVVAIPFVALVGPGVPQEGISFLFGALNVPLAWAVVAGIGTPRRVAVTLAIVFGFGSITWYSAQVGSSWHFAHVLALTFAFLAILAVQRNASPMLVGILVAAMGLSRLPMFAAVPFFLAWMAERAQRDAVGLPRLPFGSSDPAAPRPSRRLPWRRLARPAGSFAVGVGVPLVAYLWYNAARFGSPLESGYSLIPGLLQEPQYQYGFFSIDYIPRILYAMFLTTPLQVGQFPWIEARRLGGLSIVLTTPLFLWSVKARRFDWFTIGAWSAVVLVLAPLTLHADPGGLQFGFRYAQDLYPFLLLLVARALAGRIGFEAGLAIAIGLAVNLWGMASAYLDWFA